MPSPSWSYFPVSDFPLIPSTAFDSLGSVVAYPVNAAGDGVTDDTAALRAMFASGASVFDLLGRWYKINIAEGSSLAQFVGKSGIRIYGRGGGIIDARSYTTGVLTPIIKFTGCSDVLVDCNFTGAEIASPDDSVSGVGYRGAAFVYAEYGCSKVVVSGSLKHCRYGFLTGDYADPAKGGNRNLFADLETYRVGYPVAHYLAEDAHSVIHSEGTHRAAYYAGVKRGSVHASVKDQYIAPIQVLLTDAKTGTGTSRGCSDIDVNVSDRGTTHTGQTYSYLAGLSLSRVDPGTVFRNININVNIDSTDGVGSMVGGFILNSTVSAILPNVYANDWSNQIKLKDIKVSGVIDRSEQTVMSSTVYDLYIRAKDVAAPANNPVVSRITLDKFRVIAGASGSPKHIYVHAPGLVDRLNIIDSDFTTFAKDIDLGGLSATYIGTPSS